MEGRSMIGLLFFGAIALWALIALVLGVKLPEWLRIQRYRLPWTVVCVVLVFFAPVADEIIAWPQLHVMCKSVDTVEFDPQTAVGQTVSKYSSVISIETKALFPGVPVRIEQRALVTPVTEVPIVKWGSIEPRAGFLHFPAGSSGDSMPLLLSDCGFTARSSDLFLKIVEPLKLVKTDYRPSK
jgi:hypothetical protein